MNLINRKLSCKYKYFLKVQIRIIVVGGIFKRQKSEYQDKIFFVSVCGVLPLPSYWMNREKSPSGHVTIVQIFFNMKGLYLLFLFPLILSAQTNIISTSVLAEQIMLGNYNPALFAPLLGTPGTPETLGTAIQNAVSSDSLKSYILKLSEFGTRNSGSDTISNTQGIGAARRWIWQRFQSISTANQQRLIPSYLQFDQAICDINQHKNVFAVLPGSNPNSGVIVVEGHMDSRCSVLCDPDCQAEGVEDNATGTALVIELARIMARYQFANTIVFVITTAEEQGLYGANAFATYVVQKSINLRAVLNNDVIGGVICGETSSLPSCPGLNNIDSTSVRLFSSGGFNSKHKQLARYIKLEYQENVLPTAVVPMNIRIMSPEDRTGRGGDHQPFRQKGFTAMRFTSANEHGDASNGASYTDRQHTSDDVLGVDTDGDTVIDSFFVDFNYLSRNAVINANALAMAAFGVALPPDFTAVRSGGNLTVTLNSLIDTFTFRIAFRTTTNDWDTVYTVSSNSATVPCPATGLLNVSIAGVNEQGIESLFSVERSVMISASDEPTYEAEAPIRLFQNKPNPFDEATWISFWFNEIPRNHPKAVIQIIDLQGKMIQEIPVKIQQGMNEVLYTHGYGVKGTFTYILSIDGKIIDSKQMIFAN